MKLSTLDQRFLDLIDRIDQAQQSQIAALTEKLEAAELKNSALEKRIDRLEELVTRERNALQNLNATLAHLLDPSASSQSSGVSQGGSET